MNKDIPDNLSNHQKGKPMVQWSDDLSYGVKGMDDDHKVMISLVNHMYSIATDEKDNFDARLLLAKLAEYAIRHFRREEIVMQTCHYPEMEEHIEHHHDLELQVFELLKKKDRKLNAEETEGLLHFLSDWLFDHISTIDQVMTPYVAKYIDEIDSALKDTKAITALEQ